MNAEKYTQKTLDAVKTAQSMAQENGNQYLTPEHLLYALVDQDGGLIASLFGKMGVDCDGLLSELDKSDLEKFEAAVASGEHTSGAGDLINLAENLDCYDFYIGVSDDETLGRIYAEDMEMIDIPENLRDYFDYEAYGRDMRINEDGSFVKGGFFLPNGSQFIEYYHGREDIPAEHKVFAYPRLSIREQMAAYKEVIGRFPQAAERPNPEQGHSDR